MGFEEGGVGRAERAKVEAVCDVWEVAAGAISVNGAFLVQVGVGSGASHGKSRCRAKAEGTPGAKSNPHCVALSILGRGVAEQHHEEWRRNETD